jgi:SAM-dependent methyltransferase
MYNPRGLHKLSPNTPLPVVGTFDAIWMFSVVTHLNADDTNAMLAILRRAVRPGGALLFSACLRADTNTWREGEPDKPGAVVYYNEQFLREIVSRNGWDISAVYPYGPAAGYIAQHLVCRPVL